MISALLDDGAFVHSNTTRKAEAYEETTCKILDRRPLRLNPAMDAKREDFR